MIHELFELDGDGAYFSGRPLLPYLVADVFRDHATRWSDQRKLRDDALEAIAKFTNVDVGQVALFPNRCAFWSAVLVNEPGAHRLYTSDNLWAEDYSAFVRGGFTESNEKLGIALNNSRGGLTFNDTMDFIDGANSDDIVCWSLASPVTGTNGHGYISSKVKAVAIDATGESLSDHKSLLNTNAFYSNLYVLLNADQLFGPDIYIGIAPRNRSWRCDVGIDQTTKQTAFYTSHSSNQLLTLGPSQWAPPPEYLAAILRGLELAEYAWEWSQTLDELSFDIPGISCTARLIGLASTRPHRKVYLLQFDKDCAPHLRDYLSEQNIHVDLAIPLESPWSHKWLNKPGIRITTHIHTTEEHVERLTHAMRKYGDEHGF